MLSKADIERFKRENLPELYALLDPTKSSPQQILFVLENLGKLPPLFNGDLLLLVFQHAQNVTIRYWAIKNLAKLADYRYTPALLHIISTSQDSQVRREATSAIGRMRDERNIDCLLTLLQDSDPNVVLQAVRGLRVFVGDPHVDDALRSVANHPNETVRAVVQAASAKTPSRVPHPEFPTFLGNVAVLGDVLQVLPFVPDEAVHLTFTSPPYYNARDYSIYPSYQAYLEFLRRVFQAVQRITKEGRFCVINTSPVIVPRVSRAHSSKRYPIPFDLHGIMMQLGWEFIDDIVWVKPETSVKNRNGGFQQHRKPLGYKPNAVTEYLMVYRKQTDKLLDWNMRQYPADVVERSKVVGSFETSNVWQIDPTFDKVHSAVFPIELCQRVIQYYSYVGDLVFDPFAGSGTLGAAALDLSRNYFLTEQNPLYFERMKQRLSGQLFVKTQFLSLEAFQEKAQAHRQ